MTEQLWLLSVVEPAASDTPNAMLILQPAHPAEHAAIATRLRRAHYGRITPNEWHTGAWPLSPTSAIDIQGDDLVRLTTGTASLYSGPDTPVTPRWAQAARARRALVGLVTPRTVDPDMPMSEALDAIAARCGERLLLGALVTVRFDLGATRPTRLPLHLT